MDKIIIRKVLRAILVLSHYLDPCFWYRCLPDHYCNLLLR